MKIITSIMSINNNPIEKVAEQIVILLDSSVMMSQTCLYNLHIHYRDSGIDIENMTLRGIATFCMGNIQEHYLEGIPQERRLNIIEHIFKITHCTNINETLVMNCHLYMEASPRNPQLPTISQLIEFTKNQIEMMQYIESGGTESAYHDRHQVYVGLPSIDRFRDTLILSTGDNCAICCYELKPTQDVYKMPCGHIFHRDNAECKRNGVDGIVEWFSLHVRCPVCNIDIRELE
jgi:hypothetical protein